MHRMLQSVAWPGVLLAGTSLPALFAADEAGNAAKLPPAATAEIDFARDVQPIFEKFCLKCHGAQKQLSGFRLDLEGDAVRGGDSGAAFEPGKSGDSLLIQYVAGLDPELVMPPKGDRLSAEQIGVLRAWIDQGAKWSGSSADATAKKVAHWSFQPIVRPTEPAVQDERQVRNAIDRFVLARLAAEKIAPSPEADRRTLIRRLSLDLLGLPPTPEEIEQFVNNTRPDAYAELVDRLLASPHFGERWGRHWLDLARYADSDGYEKDRPRPHAWRYRQWVIEAINRDLPFDQFTIEQLAGDLLPNAVLEQKIATGFHRNTLTNREDGTDQEEFRVAAVVDRVNTTSAVWLGLTMGCCQCHTHKYDPLTLREYYGMFAFFDQGQEVDLPAPDPKDVEAYAKAKAAYDAAHAPYLAAITEFQIKELPSRLAAWEAALDLSKFVNWTRLEPTDVASTGGVTFVRLPDGSYLATGEDPRKATTTIKVNTEMAGITAFRLETLRNPPGAETSNKSARVVNGNFALSEFRVASRRGDNAAVPVALKSAVADLEAENYPASAAIDGRGNSGWAVGRKNDEDHFIVFETAENVDAAGTELTFVLGHEMGERRSIGRFRLSATTAPRPVGVNALPDDVRPILATAAADRSPEQQSRLLEYYGSIDSEFDKLKRDADQHAKKEPSPPGAMAQTLADLATPRKTHIHIRGDFLRKGDEVSPHTPAVLPALVGDSDRPLNRLDLARWLVSPENPLTARVTVNRIWKHLFGQALVTSIDDFGTRGEKPSHPELLDWLAAEFMQPEQCTTPGNSPSSKTGAKQVASVGDGAALVEGETAPGALAQSGGVPGAWSVKRLIRLIVMSATYRQSSAPRPELVELDPRNVLLSHQNRFRLEAEVIRDVYLAASGLLVAKVGGPSVRPKQPAGIAQLTYNSGSRWVDSTGDDRFRRGLYTWFQRTSPYPMLMTFDAPESNVTCVRRDRSNTPLQALTLLNDPVFHECSQALGRRLVREAPDDLAQRLSRGCELCVGRPPTEPELARLTQLYGDLRHLAAADASAARQLAGDPTPSDTELPDAAASVAVARILLNLDELVTRE